MRCSCWAPHPIQPQRPGWPRVRSPRRSTAPAAATARKGHGDSGRPARRAPDYTATDQEWTDWADDNRSRSGIGGFLILLAGFALLHFAATMRSVLGSAETTVRGSVQLARVAFPGAVVGAAGIATARQPLRCPRSLRLTAVADGNEDGPSRLVTRAGGSDTARRKPLSDVTDGAAPRRQCGGQPFMAPRHSGHS
jgi:hypothetical protein